MKQQSKRSVYPLLAVILLAATVLACVKTTTRQPLLRKSVSNFDVRGSEIHAAVPMEFPGLGGFTFDFDFDDHEIEHIQTGTFLALPDEGIAFEDRVFVAYHDANEDDPYSWNLVRQELPAGTTLHQVDGCHDHLDVITSLTEPGVVGVPVLLGFDLDFAGDHNLDRIKVELFRSESDRIKLHVIYEDKGADGPHACFVVAWALVPPTRVRASFTLSGISGGGTDSQDFIGGDFLLLQGFEMNFSTGDHHIDELGVEFERIDTLHVVVAYNDQNDDDDFVWNVQVVDLRQ